MSLATKNCININSTTGRAKIRAIGPSPSVASSSLGSRGYTKNHLAFSSEFDRLQRKANGSIPSGTVTPTIILTRPQTKGSAVVFLAIDAVCF